MFAPIGISTYGRLSHLTRTVNALKRNTIASDSHLYVFSDAAKPGDEEKIGCIREYIHTINGFEKVSIIERETNLGVGNGRGGIKKLLDEYGKVIFLEEDIVTAPGFLQFMNDALIAYEFDENVMTITGYCPPFNLPIEHEQDAFVLQRFCGWGFATWSDRFSPFGFDLKQYDIDGFMSSRQRQKNFKKNGDDMYRLLLSVCKGEIDALDVRITYYQFMKDKFTLYPYQSLVQNIGHDGSGLNCDANDKFDHGKLWDKSNGFAFEERIHNDKHVDKVNSQFYSKKYPGNFLTSWLRKLKASSKQEF